MLPVAAFAAQVMVQFLHNTRARHLKLRHKSSASLDCLLRLTHANPGQNALSLCLSDVLGRRVTRIPGLRLSFLSSAKSLQGILCFLNTMDATGEELPASSKTSSLLLHESIVVAQWGSRHGVMSSVSSIPGSAPSGSDFSCCKARGLVSG